MERILGRKLVITVMSMKKNGVSIWVFSIHKKTFDFIIDCHSGTT